MLHNNGVMFVIMILSGLLSTMNLWVDKWSDIRWSLNDIYMATAMTGWMFFFMALYSYNPTQLWLGVGLLFVSFICIRSQFLINTNQYINGMIPHHSMAVLMTKKLLGKNNILPKTLQELTNTIIVNQEKEIAILKSL
jgi:hypothetical protein